MIVSFACASFGCGGTSDPTSVPTSEPLTAVPSSAAPEASTAPVASATPSSSPGETEREATIASGEAKTLSVKNGAGEELAFTGLEFASFARKSSGLPSKELPAATVSFARVTADGATATDVSCQLAEWPELPDDATAATTLLITLALKDAVPAAQVLKAKKALLACSKAKPLRLVWSFEGDRLHEASAEGVDPACVTKALGKLAALGTGACAATIAP